VTAPKPSDLVRDIRALFDRTVPNWRQELWKSICPDNPNWTRIEFQLRMEDGSSTTVVLYDRGEAVGGGGADGAGPGSDVPLGELRIDNPDARPPEDTAGTS
jgi:hypothetical protein